MAARVGNDQRRHKDGLMFFFRNDQQWQRYSSGGSLRSSTMLSSAATIKMMSSSTDTVKNPSLSFSSSNNSVYSADMCTIMCHFETSWLLQLFQCFASATGIDRVNVQNPIVEMDGEEMTAIIWQMIKDNSCFLT